MPDRTYTAVATGAGLATVTIAPDRREVWSVSQVSMEMSAATSGTTCTLRKNGSLVSPLVAQADSAAGDPPVVLLPLKNDRLTVEWVGAPVGAVGSVYIIYDQLTT